MAQSNLSSHSLSPRINRRSPASASEDDFHHRTSSAVRTASPGINIAYSSEEELLHQRASSSTPERQLGSDVPATDPERHATVISEDPEHAVDAHISKLLKLLFGMQVVAYSKAIVGVLGWSELCPFMSQIN